MKLSIHLALYFFTSLLLITSINNLQAQQKLISPSFIDNGKIIDSLKKAYNCETIAYENTADKKMVDSCLTVYLINSTDVLSDNDFNKNANHLKNVAVAIKHALANPQDYKTIYVFFDRKYSQNGREKKMHTGGIELSTKGL